MVQKHFKEQTIYFSILVRREECKIGLKSSFGNQAGFIEDKLNMKGMKYFSCVKKYYRF